HLTFLDDDLFYDPKESYALYNEMVRRNLGMTWDAPNGVIVSSAVTHPEIMAAAAQSGCVGMFFGIESGSAQILKEVRKPSGIKHFLQLGQLMHQYPTIFTKGFLMIGFPGETIRQMQETIALAQTIGLDWYSIQIVAPLAKTEMYDQFVDLNDSDRLILREGERQRVVERHGTGTFFKFLDADENYVPNGSEMSHIWFDIDFLINYTPLLQMTDQPRLEKAHAFLMDVCSRRVGANPVPNLFLGLVSGKLGRQQDQQQYVDRAITFLADNPYWQTRLSGLHIDVADLIGRCRSQKRLFPPHLAWDHSGSV
ncbi:MAG: hypothetical protein HQL60_08650, partial [Magnetococcales bacterium]|nr:hypothetical protein [Magnetococcales bacterium]